LCYRFAVCLDESCQDRDRLPEVDLRLLVSAKHAQHRRDAMQTFCDVLTVRGTVRIRRSQFAPDDQRLFVRFQCCLLGADVRRDLADAEMAAANSACNRGSSPRSSTN